MTKAVCKAMQLQGVVEELEVCDPTIPIPVLCDSKACLDSIICDRLTTSTRHATNKTAFLREMRQLGVFTPHLMSTKVQVADLNTKPHAKFKFGELTDMITGYEPLKLLNVMKESEMTPYSGTVSVR